MATDAHGIASTTARALALIVTATASRLPLDPLTGQKVRGQTYLLAAILAPTLRTSVDGVAVGQLIVQVSALMAGAVQPADALQPFYDAADAASIATPFFASPARTRAAGFGRLLAGCAEATFLGQAFLAQAQITYPDRQSAVAARKRIADAMDASLDRIAARTGQAVVDVLGRVARYSTGHIANVAANLQPIVRVTTPRSAPATALAYALYGDPARAPELVARAQCGTSLFMPTHFDALSPTA